MENVSDDSKNDSISCVIVIIMTGLATIGPH